MKKEIKIPTLLAIFLIVVVLGGATVFTNYSLRVIGNAQSNPTPQHVAITTITDSSFFVTWETDSPSLSAAAITDPKGEKQTFFDERHVVGDTQKYRTHSVPIRGLQPETDYKLELMVNGKSFIPQDNPLVHTGPKFSIDTNGMSPVYGSILTKDNLPADGALVFLSVGEDSQLLSALVKPSGSWIIPLNLLRTKDLNHLIEKKDERQQISITVKYNGDESTVVTDTLNASPVPPVLVGNTYDFRGQQAKKKSEPKRKDIANSFSSVLGVQDNHSNSGVIALTNPSEGAHIPSTSPLISGRGIPGSIVTLLIGVTNAYTQSTNVSADGTWQLSPKKQLGIGQQRVTMTTFDEKKNPVAITHLFEVMKSGTQVLGDATPSATIATTPTNTPIPSPTTFTPSPTIEVVPTTIPTPTPTVPKTATTLPTNMLLIVGMGLLLTGLIIVAL